MSTISRLSLWSAAAVAVVALSACGGNTPEPAVVLIKTSLGDLTVELNTTKAPITSANFLRYVESGYYQNTVFHRVISNFMVQGGGFAVGNTSVPKGGTYAPIVLERTTVTGLSNVAGTIAMARTGVENSATSQFFINVVDNSGQLDARANSAGYAVFGRVVTGADTTLQALRAVQVQNNGAGEVSLPLSPPVILSATRVR